MKIKVLLSALIITSNLAFMAQPDDEIEQYLKRKCIDGKCKTGTGVLQITFKWDGDKEPLFRSTYSGTFVNKKLNGKGSYLCVIKRFKNMKRNDDTLSIEGNFVNGYPTGEIEIYTPSFKKFSAIVYNKADGKIDSIISRSFPLTDTITYSGNIALDAIKPNYPPYSFKLNVGGVMDINNVGSMIINKEMQSVDLKSWIGICTMLNGDKIEGAFNNRGLASNNIKAYYADGDTLVIDNSGRDGNYKYANGDKYIGDYLNRKRHGPGKFKFKDGTTEEVIYENNIIVARKGDEDYDRYKAYYDAIKKQREDAFKALLNKIRSDVAEKYPTLKPKPPTPIELYDPNQYTVTFILVKRQSSFLSGTRVSYSAVFVDVKDLTKKASVEDLLAIGKATLDKEVDIGSYKISRQSVERNNPAKVKAAVEKNVPLMDFRVVAAELK